MMGARTGDRNGPVASEKRDRLGRWKHGLSSSGAIKKCSSRPERSLLSSGPFSFIKVMIGAYTEALIIPPKASANLKCMLDRNVCLEDSEMQTYLVTVSVFNGALAFRHGWDRFLSDHRIEYGEVVVFNYTRGLKFSVQIYGKTGCERTCFLRSCQMNLKRKNDEVETSNFSLLHRGSKIFETAKEQPNSNLEATTREMSSDIALEFSKSDQPSCGAVTETYVDGNLCENSCIQHDNIKRPKAYSAVNRDTATCDRAVREPNVNSNIPKKSGNKHDNLKKPQGYVLNCDTTPYDGAETEPKVDSIVPEKSGIEQDNLMMPQGSSVANCDTKNIELTVEDPAGNPENKNGSINAPLATGQGINNQDNSFYYACIDLSKGSEVRKSVGSKANKMKGMKANKKRNPFKGQLLSAMASVKSQNMFKNDLSTDIQMKEKVVPVCSNMPMTDKAENITGKFIKLGSNSSNLDRWAVAEGKVFLDAEPGQEKHRSSNVCTDNFSQFASAVGSAFSSRYLEEPKNKENIQSCAANFLGNTKKVDKVPCTKEASTNSASNSAVRHDNEAATLLSDCDLERLTMLDCSSCRFIVNEEGICFVVEEDLIVEPNLSTIIPLEIDDSDMDIERCKEISLSKSPFVEPQVEKSFNDTQFTCYAKKYNEKQQVPLDSHVVLPTVKAECVVDHPILEPIKSPECHEKIALVGGSSQLVPEENTNKLAARKGTVGALVKVESVDSIVLSAVTPVKLILSITIPAQPWLELPAALPLKGKKDGGKVVTLRDPRMRTWPVLYHESFRFIGFLGGWFALATANNLQPGDACDLEALAELDMILVHIK